jgi:hypothetical protein
LALSTSSNFPVILPILFVKLAKTPAKAVATLVQRIRPGIRWYLIGQKVLVLGFDGNLMI